MVVAVYSDRRPHEVAIVAEGLARALNRHTPGRRVLLLRDRSLEVADAHVEPRVAERRLTVNEIDALARYNVGDVVVVAQRGPVSANVVAVFDKADAVLLLTDESVATLRSTQRTLKLFAALGYGVDRVLVVALHDPSQATADMAVIAHALDRDVAFSLSRAPAQLIDNHDDDYGRAAALLVARLSARP